MAANITQFCVTVNVTYPASIATNGTPGQGSSWQIVTPWGQTSSTAWAEALANAFTRHSIATGKMGNYFNAGTTNGLATSSLTAPSSANDIIGTDL